MKKFFVSFFATTAILFSFVVPTTTINAAEFISIGTGGPTGVYFVVGNMSNQVAYEDALDYVAGYSIGLDMTVRGTEERSASIEPHGDRQRIPWNDGL